MTLVTDKMLEELEVRIKEILSPKRYLHTRGVVDAAMRLGDLCLGRSDPMLIASAFLHDLTKELSDQEQMDLIQKYEIELDDEDLQSPAILHSFTAPEVIKRDFPEFANDFILNAVRNHTIGSPHMSILDEIIFLADFIEQGRNYEACVALRHSVYSAMTLGDVNGNIKILHSASVKAIDSTILNLIDKKKPINSKNILTRNALLSKI